MVYQEWYQTLESYLSTFAEEFFPMLPMILLENAPYCKYISGVGVKEQKWTVNGSQKTLKYGWTPLGHNTHIEIRAKLWEPGAGRKAWGSAATMTANSNVAGLTVDEQQNRTRLARIHQEELSKKVWKIVSIYSSEVCALLGTKYGQPVQS